MSFGQDLQSQFSVCDQCGRHLEGAHETARAGSRRPSRGSGSRGRWRCCSSCAPGSDFPEPGARGPFLREPCGWCESGPRRRSGCVMVEGSIHVPLAPVMHMPQALICSRPLFPFLVGWKSVLPLFKGVTGFPFKRYKLLVDWLVPMLARFVLPRVTGM